MKNVIISFGDYPTFLDQENLEGPYTSDQLGVMWLDWVAELSPENIRRYHLIVVTPKKIVLPDSVKAWGSFKRFDENSGVSGWPQGPNAVFKQVQWYYFHQRITGAFLWCEPDCIPLVPDWLDRLADDYLRHYKPFMGGLVDVRSLDGKTQVPRHMTGNGIYPERAYEKAPALMEANNTPWDVYAAHQILPQCHVTRLIQHRYRHPEIRSLSELKDTLWPDAVLFHSDKFGAIRRLLGKEQLPAERDQVECHNSPGKTLVEVFAQTPPPREDYSVGAFGTDIRRSAELPKPSLADFTIDNILEYLRDQCRDLEIRKLVARFMVENDIVNAGHISYYLKRLKKERALDVLADSTP